MKTIDRAKANPAIEHTGTRLVENRKTLDQTKSQAGEAICTACGAINSHKFWFCNQKKHAELSKDPLTRYAVCPGCQRVADKHYEGELILESADMLKAKDVVYATLYHTLSKAYMHNPLSQVAVVDDDGDKMRIMTTTCTLAERLGKAMHRAFKGKLKIKPSTGVGKKFVRVEWTK
ncbi:MAG: hypothetical protein JST01_13295 [Cyanobacteria bacterium SZAS TMP-1]|nr:hypothetical protein [Cyanobacteria bacterium SZAS TMP-1]